MSRKANPDRQRRWALVGFALTLLTTLLAGLDRLEAGKTRQAVLFFAGAALGAFVYARRRRRARHAAIETATPPAAAGAELDETAAERSNDV